MICRRVRAHGGKVGFFIFGCLIALVARITHGKVKHAATGCGNCPNAAVCGKIGKEA